MNLIGQKYQLGANVLVPGLVQSGVNCIIGMVCLVPAANEQGYAYGYAVMTNTTGKWVPIEMPTLLKEDQLQLAPVIEPIPAEQLEVIRDASIGTPEDPLQDVVARPIDDTTDIALHELQAMSVDEVASLLTRGIITKEQAIAATGRKVETVAGVDYLETGDLFLHPQEG